jgi:hypothetical protein
MAMRFALRLRLFGTSYPRIPLACDLSHFFALDGAVRLERFDQLIERIIVAHQLLKPTDVFVWRAEGLGLRWPNLPPYYPLLTWLARRDIESDEFIALDKRMFGACG